MGLLRLMLGKRKEKHRLAAACCVSSPIDTSYIYSITAEAKAPCTLQTCSVSEAFLRPGLVFPNDAQLSLC